MSQGKRFAIILAGGEGERLRGLTTSWLGRHVPKQYCAFSGRKTMLEHTVQRASMLVPSHRIVTIIGAEHRRLLDLDRTPGVLVEQPKNLDTAPGILLPLTHVLRADPEATVAVFPSDHFIRPNDRFKDALEEALALAESQPGSIVLMGATPEGPETEFGWIEAGPPLLGSRARVVSRFVEKPDAAEAERVWRGGALWNTLIMAFRARTLWDLAGSVIPGVRGPLERLLDPKTAGEDLRRAYESLPKANFSKHLLERIPGRILVMPMPGVEWSDWGRPERILSTLKAIGRRPRFPVPQAVPLTGGAVPAYT